MKAVGLKGYTKKKEQVHYVYCNEVLTVKTRPSSTSVNRYRYLIQGICGCRVYYYVVKP